MARKTAFGSAISSAYEGPPAQLHIQVQSDATVWFSDIRSELEQVDINGNPTSGFSLSQSGTQQPYRLPMPVTKLYARAQAAGNIQSVDFDVFAVAINPQDAVAVRRATAITSPGTVFRPPSFRRPTQIKSWWDRAFDRFDECMRNL